MSNHPVNINNIRNFVNSLPEETSSKSQKLCISELYTDDILPFELYRGTRMNIEKIADQINKSFYYGVYDGTAVLMRRLIEMLLILAFKYYKQDDYIRSPDDNYIQLTGIINQSIQNRELDLTRNTKDYLKIFKDQGGLSAHNPFHNCLKKDIVLVQSKFRVIIEELLYKSGILT